MGQQIYSITQPELFNITDGINTWSGADQEWYQNNWRAKAGCGTTTAAHLISYLSEIHVDYKDLYLAHSRKRDDFLNFMNELWDYVTPGLKGLNTITKFVHGVRAYAIEKGVTLSFHKLNITRKKTDRPTIDQCITFLQSAMKSDRPVAFLNLSSGTIKDLESWHWVTIIAFEEQPNGIILCTALNSSGQIIIIDFQQWLQTSRLGGGLVYIA